MPKNEPVKLVYPSNNNNNNNTQSSTIVTMNNNRVTFSSAPVQNGTITLSPMTQQGQQQQVMQGGNIKITGQQQGQQAPTLIFKNANSSAPGTYVTSSPVTMSKTNNQVREDVSRVKSKWETKRAMAMTEISVFVFLRLCVVFALAPNCISYDILIFFPDSLITCFYLLGVVVEYRCAAE